MTRLRNMDSVHTLVGIPQVGLDSAMDPCFSYFSYMDIPA